MKIGYVRVSKQEQNEALQIDALKAAGCEKWFVDKITGSQAERKGLNEALAYVRPDDTFMVWKLDRAGRSLKHLIELLKSLQERGIEFMSLTEQIDTTTPGGKLIFHLMGALAEFERDLIRERTNAGLAAARAVARRLGSAGSGDEVRSALLSALHDSVPAVRADEEALEDLARKEDEDPMVVQAAHRSLSNLSTYHDALLARSEAFIQIIGSEELPHPLAKPIEPAYLLPQHVGDVEFDGIEPGFLNIMGRIPITAQAPDNQWIPRTLLKALLAGRTSLESAQDYLAGLVRTEYLRSLINGEQIIMNRAFLYNNSVIARD